MTKKESQARIEELLRKNPAKSYSREEILNLIAKKSNEKEIERILAELEVSSSLKESKSKVYATCMAGTVYYKWNA